jgi:hypothetical protein
MKELKEQVMHERVKRTRDINSFNIYKAQKIFFLNCQPSFDFASFDFDCHCIIWKKRCIVFDYTKQVIYHLLLA